jgi:hypothetical protein
MEEIRSEYKVLVRRCEGKRYFGRSRAVMSNLFCMRANLKSSKLHKGLKPSDNNKSYIFQQNFTLSF